MKNSFLILLTLAQLISLSYAQKDPKAEEILRAVSTKYKSYKSISASFKIAMDNPKEKTSDNQKGSIIIAGNKYRLLLAGQEIISDGKTVWTYIKESNEVQISEPQAKANSITPANIFTVYENGFESKYTGDKTIDGKEMQMIELVPTDKKKNFFKIQLNISKAEKYVASAKVFDKNGNHYEYSVEKFIPDPAAPDNLFTFDKSAHPKVEEIDLR